MSIAVLEKLIWIDDYASAFDRAYRLVPLAFDPEKHPDALSDEDLPEDWNAAAHSSQSRQIGVQWLSEERSLLAVPSVTVPRACNYLFNPLHPAAGDVVVGEPRPLQWDPRLLPGSS